LADDGLGGSVNLCAFRINDFELVSRVGIVHVGEAEGRSRVADAGTAQPTRT
jgi:hypothetical protein